MNKKPSLTKQIMGAAGGAAIAMALYGVFIVASPALGSLTAQSSTFAEERALNSLEEEFNDIASEADSLSTSDESTFTNQNTVEQQMMEKKTTSPNNSNANQATETFHAGGTTQRQLNQSGPVEAGSVAAALLLTVLWRRKKQLTVNN
jgi:hypothetical protein